MASAKDDNDQSTESPSVPKNQYKDPDDGRQRFLLELEFVQCLSNPTYIHYLAQNRFFEDEAFIGYLKYLQYWQRPEYIKFIMYPHCLFFLELLQNANFRNAMAHPGSKELAHRQQYFFWKNYRNNRLKHILPRPLPEPAAPPAPAPAPAPSPAPLPPLTTASAPALSPMQFVGPPGSSLPKADMRSSMGDRRKRKYIDRALEHRLGQRAKELIVQRLHDQPGLYSVASPLWLLFPFLGMTWKVLRPTLWKTSLGP